MKAPLIVRAWYVVTEPWDAWAFYTGRFRCRVLGRHNRSCRGRADHPKGVRR